MPSMSLSFHELLFSELSTDYQGLVLCAFTLASPIFLVCLEKRKAETLYNMCGI